MSIAEEITQVDAQLADADRAQQSAVVLRARRAELIRARELLAEAQRREREAQEAAKAAEIAEAEDRHAQAVPLVAELEAIDAELAAFEKEAEAQLWAIVRAARTYHQRHAALVTKYNEVLAQLRDVSPEAASRMPVGHPESLRAFAARRWSQFNGRGPAADGSCDWSRALVAEEVAS